LPGALDDPSRGSQPMQSRGGLEHDDNPFFVLEEVAEQPSLRLRTIAPGGK
jgi:hypothetical protein